MTDQPHLSNQMTYQFHPSNQMTYQPRPSSKFYQLSINQDENNLRIAWEGVLECISDIKTPSNAHKNIKPIRAQISEKIKNLMRGENEEYVNTEMWPQKLLLELLPDEVVSDALPNCFFYSKSLFLHPQKSEAVEAINEILMNTFAGVVHINCQSRDTILMVLTYYREEYNCLIPQDQTLFRDTLDLVIQQYQEKNCGPLNLPVVGYTWFDKLVEHELQTTWRGTLKWEQECKIFNYTHTSIFGMPCDISCFSQRSLPEIEGYNWPEKLTMELVPVQVIENVGEAFQKNSKTILFHLEPSKALNSLTSVLTSGFAGCVHIPIQKDSPNDIKVMVLMYNTEGNGLYRAFVPNNQEGFVNGLQKATKDYNNTTQNWEPQKLDWEEQNIIWQGVLMFPVPPVFHWHTDLRSVACRVSAMSNNGEPEVKADFWPQNMTMHLLSASVIREVCADFFNNSKLVRLQIQCCQDFMALVTAFSCGYVGYVHLNRHPHDKKLMIVYYIALMRECRGVIPNDQEGFSNRIVEVLQNHQIKTVEALNQQRQNLNMNMTQEQMGIYQAEGEAGAVGGARDGCVQQEMKDISGLENTFSEINLSN